MPVYQDKATKRWRYRFAYAGERHGGTAPIGGNTRRIAEQLERDHIDRVSKGRELPDAPTIRDFVPRFLEHQKARTKQLTQRAQKLVMDVRVVPAIGKLRLNEVRRADLDKLVTAWSAEGLAKSTVNNYLAHVQSLFSVAKKWGLVEVLPPFEYLKVTREEVRFLSEDEARRLLAVIADPGWRSMAFIGLRTGLRIGELRALRWSDVKLERASITVNQTAPGLPGLEPNSPKGNASRDVPLSPEALAVLLARREEHATGYVWARMVGHKRIGNMWRSAPGTMHAMERFAKLGGFVDHRGKADIGWHTLRHTYASWLVMRGVPLRVVQKYMGHSSIVQTERYAHLGPEFSHAGIALLDAPLLAPVRPLELPSGDGEQ